MSLGGIGRSSWYAPACNGEVSWSGRGSPPNCETTYFSRPSPRAITFQPDIYDRVLEALPEDRDLSILDVGAGEEDFSRKLKDAGYDQVEACDYVEEGFCCPDIPFDQANLYEALPYPDDHLGCVVSVEVIEHLENHLAFLRELVRVTRPGGKLIITTPNVMSLSSRWHFFLYGYYDCAPLPLLPHQEDWYMQHLNPISMPMLLYHFERNRAQLIDLRTNRLRTGSRLMRPFLGPLMRLCLRKRLLREKYAQRREVFDEHLSWVLTGANWLGRITMATTGKRP